MALRHVPILKAKKGEFDALAHTQESTARRMMPLFEVGPLTESIMERGYISRSSTPRITYLERTAEKIALAWPSRPAMADCYFWQPDATTEQGEHIMAHLIGSLERLGVPVVPVIGYDRWQHPVYRAGLSGITVPGDRSFCIRLDNDALEDSADPEFFQETISGMLDELDLLPSRCFVLLDFGDVTGVAVADLVAIAGRTVRQLAGLGFGRFITAGCSIPRTINLAVEEQDSTAMVIRREYLLWQALRAELPGVSLVYGDYAVRGPNTNDDIRSKFTNGKIRHTTANQTFVVRGHPFVNDGSYLQMHALADEIVRSRHYLGPTFSWGDERIHACHTRAFVGSTTNWISIDTNHHLAYVVQEVEEFERSVTAQRERVR